MTENTQLKKKLDFNKYVEKVKPFLGYVYREYIKFPAYILAHPIRGFDMFKRDKKGKLSVAIVFVILLIILSVLDFQYSGFVVNQRDPNDLNTLAEIAYIVVPLFLVTVGNWSVTTLLDGKGKMKEIFMMICYSFFPMIFSLIFGLFFSNMIVVEEAGFYQLIIGAGAFLTGYMIFFGLVSIHEFGVMKCVLSIFLTLLAVMVLLFIIMLGYDLIQKMIGFIYTVYREISLRYM